MEIRIYYEDTDCGGVVYYANYLRYFERARTEFLESRGLSVRTLMDEDTMFVVVRAELSYQSPARYGDTLLVETTISEITAASFWINHVVRDKSDGHVVVTGSARLAVTGKNGKVKRLDKSIFTALDSRVKGTADG
ncbi:thioesterase family protein [Nitrospira sp. KM1]|uniref:acyl-CoA thioesterase n=1 Tax=Nitrospira sp. KM1 TaxID=1936990 RepID=UPI0015643AA0|nr:YbgC/FadM family acyl-CoA thioesterase [Nitrospira sp. KM1]